eukprot:XP_001610298.1 membrane protein [Babesia bovis T2Bo]
MTWYHWVLLVLLVVLQVVAVALEQVGWGLWKVLFHDSIYPIYGIAVVLLVVLSILCGTLYCGWKCNLFCRPCCKSQYICYGSAIVVVLVVLLVLAVTASMVKYLGNNFIPTQEYYNYENLNEIWSVSYLGKVLVPCTQCYAMAVLWNTTLRLPYTVAEVVALVVSALALVSILALAALPSTVEEEDSVSSSATAYSFLAVHLIALSITWYCLEYKGIFYWPKDYMCFGLFAAVVILVALVVVVIQIAMNDNKLKGLEFTLLGYSIVLMVPTLWYAYRCGLLTWRWNSCLPKKKDLKTTDSAENTTPDTDIAKE